ncbi:hypothetical protein [Serratia liquefaciens]
MVKGVSYRTAGFRLKNVELQQPEFQNWLAKRREWLAAQGKLPGEQKPNA